MKFEEVFTEMEATQDWIDSCLGEHSLLKEGFHPELTLVGHRYQKFSINLNNECIWCEVEDYPLSLNGVVQEDVVLRDFLKQEIIKCYSFSSKLLA